LTGYRRAVTIRSPVNTEPTPPYPYRQPSGPYAPPPADPQMHCKRAGILLFVVGMLIALYGIGNFTLAYTTSAEAYLQLNQQGMPGMNQPQQPQISAEALRKLALAVSVVIVVIGLALMVLSGPVRRANRSMSILAMVVVGVVAALAALFTLLAALMGVVAPPMLMLACCFSVPLGVMVWLFIWVLQAYRAAGYLAQMGAAGAYGTPPGYWPTAGQPPQYPPNQPPGGYPPAGGPPGGLPTPSSTRQPLPPVPGGTSAGSSQTPAQGNLFGAAPFGIPPPPDETGGKYGYATKPPPRPNGDEPSDDPSGTGG